MALVLAVEVNREPVMLRVTVSDEEDLLRFRLEGKLSGPWVPEFEDCWRKVRQAVRKPRAVVDLLSVDYIDEAGKCLLAVMASEGAEFLVQYPWTRALVEEVTRRAAGA